MSLGKVRYPSIEEKRKEMGCTKTAIAERLNLSTLSVKKKLDGEWEFSLTEVTELADWWGVCLDELIGRSVPKCPVLRPSFGGDDQ